MSQNSGKAFVSCLEDPSWLHSLLPRGVDGWQSRLSWDGSTVLPACGLSSMEILRFSDFTHGDSGLQEQVLPHARRSGIAFSIWPQKSQSIPCAVLYCQRNHKPPRVKILRRYTTSIQVPKIFQSCFKTATGGHPFS